MNNGERAIHEAARDKGVSLEGTENSVRGRANTDARSSVCPMCEAAGLVGRHCKLVCPNCGYVESCEDLFKGEGLSQRGY